MLKKDEVYSVKVYFIDPVDLISVVMNTLVEMEFETYVISGYDKEKLIKLFKNDIRNVLFLCITNNQELQIYTEYVEKISSMGNVNVQIGAFVYNSMDAQEKGQLLINNVSVTPFQELSTNTVNVLKKILMVFEAKGTRKHVRVSARGISEVFISIKGREKPIKGKVLDISTYAFSCEISSEFSRFFSAGSTYPEVLLALKGIRVRSAAKLVGSSKKNKELFVFKFQSLKMQESKMIFANGIARETKQKIHTYIKTCLREDISKKLAAIQEEKSPSKKVSSVSAKKPESDVEEIEAVEDEPKSD